MKTTIAGISLDNCIWNASGALCTTKEHLVNLDQSSTTGAVTSKSTTFDYREGNPLPRYYAQKEPFSTINSTGLANQGYQFYMEQQITKPYFISVAGLSMENNLKMINHLWDEVDRSSTYDAIELNLSCPNVIGKPQIGYDFEASDEILRKVFELENYSGTVKPLGLKLPPYFDQCHLTNMAQIIESYPIQFITCVNSLGNCLIIDVDTESVTIAPKKGLGGVGGSPIKPVALANVYQYHQYFGDKMDIIGCGGVQSGSDVFEHILAGAKAVQVGSHFVETGIECFDQLTDELKELMSKKGYQSITQFRGKLKEITF